MIGAIVLCRMDSTRLPGKPLLRIGGRPLIDYVWKRVAKAKSIDRVVLATSDRGIDDPLAHYAVDNGLDCFRGSIDDVAGRVLACARHYNWPWFARINGDSPFLDPALLDQGAALRDGVDLVTNLVPRSFPYGVSLELVRTEAYAGAVARMTRPDHREHVTKYLYDHLADFRYANVPCPEGNCHDVRLTVDTADDLDRFTRLVAALGNGVDLAGYADAMRFLDPGRGSA